MKGRPGYCEDVEGVEEVEKEGGWSYILEKSNGITAGQEALENNGSL
jgi:hypothetical protein